MSTSTQSKLGDLIHDARTLLKPTAKINEIFEVAQQVLEVHYQKYGLLGHPGILADIVEGLQSLFIWEKQNNITR